jgi:glycosyltransferase involved in cell wall biosynthesis
LRIAIAASGLGLIKRGMEAVTATTAEALWRRGVDVRLFRGAGPATREYERVIPTLSRDRLPARMIAQFTSSGGWRIGLGAPAMVESFVFGFQLLWRMRRGFDLLYITQGSLGLFMAKMAKIGFLKIPFVLGNNQLTTPESLSQYKYVQHLSPAVAGPAWQDHESDKRSFIIPNFVDTNTFYPSNRVKARRKLGLPADAFIVLTAGMLSRHHKRMDYFIEEMAFLAAEQEAPSWFIMAGAQAPDTDEIVKLAKSRLQQRVSIYKDLDRSRMPDLYNACDVFVLCSLVEAFGVVVIESMSCGIPVDRKSVV